MVKSRRGLMQTDEGVFLPCEDYQEPLSDSHINDLLGRKRVSDLSPIDRTTCTENSTPFIDHLRGHHGLQSSRAGTCWSYYVFYGHAQDL